jgi:hypothetical protein
MMAAEGHVFAEYLFWLFHRYLLVLASAVGAVPREAAPFCGMPKGRDFIRGGET